MAIYQSFIGLHLDYGEVVYDRASNESWHQSLQSHQYSTAIVTTETIRGIPTETFPPLIDLETLKLRGWLKKLCQFG